MMNNVFTADDRKQITKRLLPLLLCKNIQLTNWKKGEFEEIIILETIREIELELLYKQLDNKLLIKEIK